MNSEEQGSEVARLLRQIDLECEAAQRGLTGLSQGTARHDFINARLDRIGAYQEQLAIQVGEAEATRLLFEQYVKSIG